MRMFQYHLLGNFFLLKASLTGSVDYKSYYIKLHVCVIVSPSVPILRPLHVTDGKPGLTLYTM